MNCKLKYEFCKKLLLYVIKTLERYFVLTLSECLFNFLTTGESNFDEKKCGRNVQLIRVSIGKEILLIK